MSDPLLEKHCAPCEGIGMPLDAVAAQQLLAQLTGNWELVDGKKIKRTFVYSTFRKAIAFVNAIADLAEAENHHPDLSVRYNKVIVSLPTHVIGGLSENDFILARKIEELFDVIPSHVEGSRSR